MRLILVRHGETGEAYAGRYIGSRDLPLSAHGQAQAAALAERLPQEIDRCLCSPLARAQETARLALLGRTCRPEPLAGLREIDFGHWEGLSFDEILAQDPALVAEWQRAPGKFSFPGGESTVSFRQRIADALATIDRLTGDTVLVVCHGGVIRAMLCQLLGLPFERYLSFYIRPAAITELVVTDGSGVLLGHNL